MATTDPLTGATIQDQSDAATGGTQIGNAVKSLRQFVVTRFSTTGARDTAYTSFVSGGGTMADGMLTVAAGALYRRISGTWRVDRARTIRRTVVPTGAASSFGAGGSAETGITSGASGLASFTLYEACTVLVTGQFRAGSATGVAACIVKIDGAQVGHTAYSRTDGTVTVNASVALSAGSHTIALRVDATVATISWVDGYATVTECIAE